MFDPGQLPDPRSYLPEVLDGQWILLGAGGAIGALIALVLLLPWILPQLSGTAYRFGRDDEDRLAAALPLYTALDKRQQKRLTRLVKDFLKRVRFKSRNGPVAPIIRVGIAGHACSLRLYGRKQAYPKLKTLWLDAPRKRETRRVAVLDERAAQLAMGGDANNVIVRQFAQRLFPQLNKRFLAPRGWRADWCLLVQPLAADKKGLFGVVEDASPEQVFARGCELYLQRGKELQTTHPQVYSQLHRLLVADTADPPAQDVQG